MKNLNTVWPLLAAALLAACAPIERAEQENARIGASVADARSRQAASRQTSPAVFVHSGPRLLGAQAKRAAPEDLWPPALRAPFPYRSPAQTLEQVLSDLSARTGIAMVATDRVGQPAAAAVAAAAAGAQTQGGIQLAAIRSLRHEGSLAALLDQVANDADGFWRFEAGRVVFFRRETRTWQLAIPRAKRSVSESISLGGQGAAATVSVSNSSTTDPYDALRATVEGVLTAGRTGAAGAVASASGGTGATTGNLVGAAGNIVISRDFGLLTVTGTPPQLDKVAELVNVLNDRFSRNVQVNVRILNWTLSDAARLGVSANVAIETVRGRLNLSGGGVPGSSALQLTPSTMSASYTSGSGTKSIDLLLTAMSEYGQVSQVTSGDVRAVNGQPAPIQIANDIGYVASSTTTTVPNVGVQTTLTPGTVRVGFTGNFVPLLLGDGRIALDYSISLSSATIQRVSSGGTNPVEISTPNISSQSLQQSTVVRDGESIVLMGFERQSVDSNSALGLTSVGQSGSNRKEMLVIVMEVSSGK